MSKDAKMLFISLGLFLLMCIIIIFNSQYECYKVEYQNLNGTHSRQECHSKKELNCWDQYSTETEAIKMCEGK